MHTNINKIKIFFWSLFCLSFLDLLFLNTLWYPHSFLIVDRMDPLIFGTIAYVMFSEYFNEFQILIDV